MGVEWARWAALARGALAQRAEVAAEQLLIPRSLDGSMVRPMAPPPGVAPRPGAVLLLLYPDAGDLRLPLTVRSNHLPSHRGEVSLPGGATDPGDDGPVATALRECAEELGVAADGVEVWGTLTAIYIPPSNFRITPVVGFVPRPPQLAISPDEVEAVITVTLRELLDPATVVVEQWTLRGHEVQVPFFAIAGYKVWGATALILSELVARMRAAMSADRV